MKTRDGYLEKIISGIALVILFILSYLVFMRQVDGKFAYSDVVLHIEYALKGEEMYSITPFAIRVAYNMAGGRGVAVLFSLFVILAVFTTALFIRECFEDGNDNNEGRPSYWQAILLAVPFLFMTGIYIPHLFETYYLGADISSLGNPFSICAQPWHNSTYLSMRMFAPLVLLEFIRIERKLKAGDKVPVWEWVLMALFLTLTNACKPNFYLTFAPAVFILVVYDFVKSKGGTIKSAVSYGVVLLCSAGVLVFQWVLMYGEGASHESGIIITGARFIALMEAGNLIPMLVSGLLFAVIATVVCLINKGDVRIFVFVWLMFIIGICESIFLRETGIRENDLNFNWGMLFASYALNIVCFSRLIAIRKRTGKAEFVISVIPLFFMICTGIRYFWLLMAGDTFII